MEHDSKAMSEKKRQVIINIMMSRQEDLLRSHLITRLAEHKVLVDIQDEYIILLREYHQAVLKEDKFLIDTIKKQLNTIKTKHAIIRSIVAKNEVPRISDPEKLVSFTAEELDRFTSLSILGYKYVARDSVGELWAYTSRPTKMRVTFQPDQGSAFIQLSTHWFPFITWEDKHALNVNEILKGTQGPSFIKPEK